MASLSATPQRQQSFSQNASSPPGSAGRPSAMPSFTTAYNMSFESPHHVQSQPAPAYNGSFPNGPVSNPGFARSFGDSFRGGYSDKPQIYTAVYSGVTVYEMEINGVACMRRKNDSWLNATQILKVAGIDKGKRTKVLEKEILTGQHEKIQGGYGKYQGTWISYDRGRHFAQQYGVEDLFRPLFEYDIANDQQHATPTKEQAAALNRKRLYNAAAADGRVGPEQASNGTFFSNMSQTTQVALQAMHKAARLNSPVRPSNIRRPSLQDALPGGSQQSIMSDGSFVDRVDSGYNTQPSGEPARKRIRRESQEGMGPPALPLDVSMRSATPTEPNESFVYDGVNDAMFGGDESCALPPLPAPENEKQHEKMNLILDLFADSGRVDYTSHKALLHLSGEDLNMPLDASANSCLHWAATLGKVPLLKLLIAKGANIKRGNAAGQSALISAVLVSNCWEHSCFPEILELLSPLIELRDLQGRTVLHHIAVSSGIKGRAPSSKYYLEALLEFLVRIGNGVKETLPNAANQILQQNPELSSQESNGQLTLLRFLSHVVNARDKAGNTALNLAARIGTRNLIHQLLEIGADPGIPNLKGVSAQDFNLPISQNSGHEISDSQRTLQADSQDVVMDGTADGAGDTANLVEELSDDVISSITSMLSQSMQSHKDLLRERTEQIDRLSEQIRQLSAQQREVQEVNQGLQQRVKAREERLARIANLKRTIMERRNAGAGQNKLPKDPLFMALENNAELLQSQSTTKRNFIKHQLPQAPELRAYLEASKQHNATLQRRADELKSRSKEVEDMYRKVVSLATGVAEDRVEENLSALLAAVESEQNMDEQGVSRVRAFLRKIDGAGSVAL